MRFSLIDGQTREWKVEKIGVIGPGIVGMPMAAMLANARIHIGSNSPAKVMVVQRNSYNSGWKVDAINEGRSVIGGVEPGLNEIVENCVQEGLLQASSDYTTLVDADVILVAIQTDKKGLEPDYEPLFGGLTELARALQEKPAENIPLIIFESTLAPSSMSTVVREHFQEYGLVDGQDILLGNSPNRVMPGRLVERVAQSDKLVAGLQPDTPKMIKHLYSHIVKKGELHVTNSLTAEVVKTLENAYRDVRIAFSAEVVRYCDERNIDFYQLRDEVNQRLQQMDDASKDPGCVPSGGILIPTVGVGGHCLPKDGILLWWRLLQNKYEANNSLILNSRTINDDSPSQTIQLMERKFGPIDGSKVAVLGAAYRFDSEDTRNSPSIQLALQLQKRGCEVALHDPYVKPDDQNLLKFSVTDIFTNTIHDAVNDADYVIFATGHQVYQSQLDEIISTSKKIKGVVDGCNLFQEKDLEKYGVSYTGIGRGATNPTTDLIDCIYTSFTNMEKGLAQEVADICSFLNDQFIDDDFNRVQFSEVQRLAASCSTGCEIADRGSFAPLTGGIDFTSVLVECASELLEHKK